MSRPCVYRAFDVAGRLLYIGSTGDIAQRFKGHDSKQPPWLPYVSSVVVEHYETIKAARCAETLAIMAERPRFNKRDNPPFSNAPREPFRDAIPVAAFLDVPVTVLLPAGVAA